MGSWNALPNELRFMIFGFIADDYHADYDFEGKRHLLSGYAVVCRQWCYFFEHITFHSLVLNQDRIKDLQRITETRSRRPLVRHLWLRVRLDEYDCDVCREPEDFSTRERNGETFSKAVVDLMTILATWPKRKNPEHGLTLELSAFSPSDSKHAFKYFRLEENYPYRKLSDLDPKYSAYGSRAKQMKDDGSLHDPAHGWTHGRQESPPLGAKRRLKGSLLFWPVNTDDSSITSWISLRVRVVTSLLIRRQFHRQIPGPLLSDLVHKVCPLLDNFSHESWLDMEDNGTNLFPNHYMFRRLLNLSSLRLFADYNQILHPRSSDRRRYKNDRLWKLDRALSKILCAHTQHLETFAFTSVIDARDLFSLFAPQAPPQRNLPLRWRLRSLAITPNMLIKKARGWEIEYLFVAAGRAAARMPQLKTMEIWNGEKGHASIFGYYVRKKTTTTPGHETSQQEGKQFTISWKSTWSWGPDPRSSIARVARAWEEALGLASQNIEARSYRSTMSKKKPILTQAFAIVDLALKDAVLDPVSQYQLRWEYLEAQTREKEESFRTNVP